MMARPIDQRREDWIPVKEAAGIRGRTERTVYAWVRSGEVRSTREPGGRILVYRPDFIPPFDYRRGPR